jgi:hypothetical protein
LSEVVESGMTVDLDAIPLDFTLPVDFTPTQDLHVRSVDLPSLVLESRLAEKLAAVRAFAKVNSVDKHIVASPSATLGIVTSARRTTTSWKCCAGSNSTRTRWPPPACASTRWASCSRWSPRAWRSSRKASKRSS